MRYRDDHADVNNRHILEILNEVIPKRDTLHSSRPRHVLEAMIDMSTRI